LWMPMVLITRGQPSPWATLTLASMYAWGLLMAWLDSVVAAAQKAPRPLRTAATVRPRT
jgi:hypothetical protein